MAAKVKRRRATPPTTPEAMSFDMTQARPGGLVKVCAKVSLEVALRIAKAIEASFDGKTRLRRPVQRAIARRH